MENNTSGCYREFLPVIALILIQLFRAPLFGSLWLDETLSAWVTDSSFGDAFNRSIAFQAQSPLYLLFLWCWRQLVGSSEILLRLPSLLAFFLSILGMLKLSRLFSLERPWLTVIVPLVSMVEFFKAGIQARPYGFAMVAAVWGLVLYLRFLNEGKKLFFTGAFFLFILSFYFHYAFGVILLPLLLLTGIAQAIPLFIGLCIFFVPGLIHTYTWLGRSESFGFLGALSFSQATEALFAGRTFITIGFSLLLAKIWFDISIERGIPSWVRSMIALALIPGICLIFGSLVLDESLVLSRYYLPRTIGVAVLIGFVMNRVQPLNVRVVVIWAFFGFTFLSELNRRWINEDWRGASQEVVKLSSTDPVFLFSGLAELNSKDLDSNSERQREVLSPFEVYKVPNQVIAIPPHPDVQNVYVDKMIAPGISQATSFTLVAHKYVSTNGVYVVDGLKTWFEKQGFVVKARTDLSGVVVIGFLKK